jgi:hypothetical protein
MIISYRENSQNLASTQAELAATEADHESQSADYAADIQNLNDAIAACNLALDRLNTFAQANGASLIQVASSAKSHLANFAAKMKEMSHKLAKHGSMYSPLIHELVQLTQDADPSEVAEVVDRLNQLLNLLRDALADLLAQQAAYEADYTAHVQMANDNIATYQANMDYANSQADEIGAQDVQANAQLAQAQQNLEDAQNALATNEASYDANEANFADQKPR